VLDVSGRSDGTVRAGSNQYVSGPSREVGIRTNWLRAEDLYVITDQINRDGSVYFKVLVKPLVNLIWIAGILFVAGSLVALWPDAREQRRLASRLAFARA
jgi:cytochrome c biogenesis factor